MKKANYIILVLYDFERNETEIRIADVRVFNVQMYFNKLLSRYEVEEKTELIMKRENFCRYENSELLTFYFLKLNSDFYRIVTEIELESAIDSVNKTFTSRRTFQDSALTQNC